MSFESDTDSMAGEQSEDISLQGRAWTLYCMERVKSAKSIKKSKTIFYMACGQQKFFDNQYVEQELLLMWLAAILSTAEI